MKRNGIFSAILGCAFALLFLFRSAELSDGIRRGLTLCSYSVIPSLFPFMALAGFLAQSRASVFLSSLFLPLTKLLKLPKAAGSLLFSSLIGGYPSAAKSIADFVRNGVLDKKTGERMLCFCVNAGPPFLIGALGIGLFGSAEIGLFLFSAQTLSALTIAFVLSIFSSAPKESGIAELNFGKNSAVLIRSVTKAAESCFQMSAFVVLICGVTDLILDLPTLTFLKENPLWNAVFTGFFEVTAGCFSCGNIPALAAVICGGIASFSGLSVMFQIAAITDGSGISLFPFLLSRPIHALLTAGILRVLLCFSEESAAVFSSRNGALEGLLSASAPAAVSLLCMAALFLLSLVPVREAERENSGRKSKKFFIFWRRKKKKDLL